jgi:hypothetical protein
MVANTLHTHSREDVVERVVSPARSSTRIRCATRCGLVVDPRKITQCYRQRVFDRVWLQNSAVAVPVAIRGGTWRHHEGCVKAKQLHVERVAIISKSQELIHFALTKWIGSMYLGVV